MAILLIRHGETNLNATQVVQFPDTPLGENGLLQAEQLAQRLSDRRIDRILSSDYLRARTTAEYLRQHTNAPLTESEQLRERHFGELRGQPYSNFGETDIFAKDYVPQGGESWENFDHRVDLAWEEVISCAHGIDGDLAVVTHGLVLRSLMERRLDMSAHGELDELVVANTSLTEVEMQLPWRVTRLACVAHLEEGPNAVSPV